MILTREHKRHLLKKKRYCLILLQRASNRYIYRWITYIVVKWNVDFWLFPKVKKLNIINIICLFILFQKEILLVLLQPRNFWKDQNQMSCLPLKSQRLSPCQQRELNTKASQPIRLSKSWIRWLDWCTEGSESMYSFYGLVHKDLLYKLHVDFELLIFCNCYFLTQLIEPCMRRTFYCLPLCCALTLNRKEQKTSQMKRCHCSYKVCAHSNFCNLKNLHKMNLGRQTEKNVITLHQYQVPHYISFE